MFMGVGVCCGKDLGVYNSIIMYADWDEPGAYQCIHVYNNKGV